jgi:hypothetical protein
MIFNLIFIAAVLNLAKEAMHERRAARHDAPADPPDETS